MEDGGASGDAFDAASEVEGGATQPCLGEQEIGGRLQALRGPAGPLDGVGAGEYLELVGCVESGDGVVLVRSRTADCEREDDGKIGAGAVGWAEAGAGEGRADGGGEERSGIA